MRPPHLAHNGRQASHMFDAEAMLSAVDAGQAPDTWTVYRATASYFVGRGLATGFVGLFMLALVGLLVAQVGVPTGDDWWLYALFALMGLGSCLLSFVFFKEMRRRGRRILVLTPEGFVERKHAGHWPWFA